MVTKKVEKTTRMVIPGVQSQVVRVTIIGTKFYVQNKWSTRVGGERRKAHAEGDQPKGTKKVRSPRDFDAEYEAAMHRLPDGGFGIPANGLRAAMLDACSSVNAVVKLAKRALYVIEDGHDPEDGTPLVRITKGEPSRLDNMVRVKGVPVPRSRPKWEEGWEAVVNIRFNPDIFHAEDVVNLLNLAGCEGGIGEGRPTSPRSAGMGWGFFRVKTEDETSKEEVA